MSRSEPCDIFNLDFRRRSFFQSEEEINGLQKRIQQIESELDAAQEQLGEANTKLEAKEKAATDVSQMHLSIFSFSISLATRRYPSFSLSPSPPLFSSSFLGIRIDRYISRSSSYAHWSIYLDDDERRRRQTAFPFSLFHGHKIILVFSWLKAKSMQLNSTTSSKIRHPQLLNKSAPSKPENFSFDLEIAFPSLSTADAHACESLLQRTHQNKSDRNSPITNF